MRRPLVASLLTLFTVALAWANKDPWKGKPYQQWTDDDLQQIFHQSPWSHVVLIDRNWVPYVKKELPTHPLGGSVREMPSSAATTTRMAQVPQVRFCLLGILSSHAQRLGPPGGAPVRHQ
jgi:hypothetical protein